LQWFSNEEVKEIEAGILDIIGLFENKEESYARIKDFPKKFNAPAQFYQHKDKVFRTMKAY
jgi:hypothetical protein